MTFRQNIARFVTQDASLPPLQTVALQALEEGLDTPSLRILAGLPDNEYPSLVDKYFQEVLYELSIELPDRRQATLEIGLFLADEIINHKIEVLKGVEMLIDKVIGVYDWGEVKRYAYDNIGFEKAYGLFYNIEDLRAERTGRWPPNEPSKMEKELCAELLEEIKNWSLLIRNSS